MPLPPLPKAMGSILKEGEMTVKPASNPKSFKTEVKEKPVVSETNKAVKRVKSPKTADLLEKKENSTKKQKGYRAKTHGKKLFVLDTNVLMHDPISLFQFEEHDVFLPMITLEELDGHKKGMSDVARNARQVSRYLDQLLGHSDGNITEGIELSALGNTEAQGKLFFQTQTLEAQLPQGLPQGKADNQILGVVQALQNKEKERSVVLVSKDINMRIKATAMGLAAEDYFSDKTLDDTDGPLVKDWFTNLFVYLPDDSFLAQVKKIEGKTATLCVVRDYMQSKHSVWGITARNREQCFALDLLMNPDIDFVTLLGQAGTGKTLITLAAALTQTLDMRRFSEIIFTRATVSVGEEIGFLPGTEEEKMLPWMGALEDNLEVLNNIDSGSDWSRHAANDLIRSRIKVKSMSFMRGRTFLNKFVIIDEAQNLSPKQMKTLITRAGPGSKIVCLGNIAQIDTPYLTEGSSGLTYVVDRFKGWEHSGHITLQRGERSRLADFASESL